jgi:formate dehydrogenase iron-sulfur subunit
MTLALPILSNIASELANAFPPRRHAVPQPHHDGQPQEPGLHQIMGFFTDTTLCIGCKACEVACKQWNQLPSDGLNFTGNSYDNTSHLGATTWRHVAFKEKITDTGAKLLMMSDVCKHCESAPCEHACPTGAIVYNDFGDVYVQNDICNGCGYCIVACPFGVLGRADGGSSTDGGQPGDGDGHAHKCTLCYDRQSDNMIPACAKSCPTASIQFGPVEELRTRARERVEQLHGRGNHEAYLYGADSVGDYGPLNSFFLLEDHPNEYNLPEAPRQPFRGQQKRYAASFATGAAFVGLAALMLGSISGKRR